MSYISDIVEGTILAMENKKAIGQIFNIGNDEELSIIDTVNLIKKIAAVKTKPRIKFIPIRKIFGDYREIRRRLPDLTKARKILGYRPKVSLAQGLAMTIDARRQWLEKSGSKIRRENKAHRSR